MKEINVTQLNENVFEKIGKQWMLVGAMADDKNNAMTASWGGLGIMWGVNVAFVFIRDSRYTKELIDNSEMLSLSFFDETYRGMLGYMGKASGRNEDKIKTAGLTITMEEENAPVFEEADMTFVCKKMYAQKMNAESFIDKSCIEKWYGEGDYHTMYVVEIKKVLIK